MRVLHYISSFFPYDRGASHSALRLARGLRELGVDIQFVVEDFGPEWRDGGTYDGFPVRSFTVTDPGKLRKLKGFWNLRRFMTERRGQFDLLHVHGGPYMNLLLAQLGSKWLACPTLMKITLDGWDTPDGVAAGRHGRLAIGLYRKLDAIVAMTSGQAEKCREWNIPSLIEVIPNSVDVNRFHLLDPAAKRARRAELGLSPDKPVIAYAGYLGTVKGTDILFKSWAELKASVPGLQLLLVGDYMQAGNLAGSLGSFLERNGISASLAHDPDVHQTGKLDDISRHIACADIFVFPSRQEGFGTVQIEAMACGLPCIVNDLPGVSLDIFPDDRFGIRVSGNDPAAFVAAARRLLADPSAAMAMGTRARERAVTDFSVQHVAGRYAAFYERIVTARRNDR